MECERPWRRVHFTGVGGVGMAGLALILRDLGVAVSGSDEVEGKNLALLRERGAQLAVGHDAANVGDPDLLVYSSAVAPTNPERVAAQRRGIPEIRRGEFLAQVARLFPVVVPVAGSHGKTTTTAMLSHILIAAGRDPGYLVGGAVIGRAAPATAGGGQLLVTEVDESDGTQAALKSTHAIVVNVEDDHCWSLGGIEQLEQCFRDFAFNADFLLAYATEQTQRLFAAHPHVEFLHSGQIRRDLQLLVPGEHNRLNASLALRMAEHLGVPAPQAIAALATFQGADRRLTCRYHGPAVTVIEDYAHHPSEMRASLAALREQYPDCRLRVVFQPHRNERVARFTDEFAAELSRADEVVVTPPFAAWVEDAGIADPRAIPARVRGVPARYCELPAAPLAAELVATARAGDVIVVMGAGTITGLVPPLLAALQARRL